MTDITFIITRSDLLSSVQEKVDKRMEYMRSVLRDFLRQSPDDDIRVGNLHMISCFRGWRTKEVREIIAKQRGGIWIVGKTNVGKSQFIESCFPKDSKNYKKIAELVQHRRKDSEAPTQQNDVAIDPEGLLPPAPQEDLYPVLPVVSSLPGTTVSPIRIPFGRGRAELIDLPGLHRDGFEDYVVDAHKGDLTMTSYVRNPVRHVIRSGQSLLLGGGLVRVTPTEPDQVLIAACFVPLEAHVTKTEKAIKMQTQEAPYPNTQIMKEGVGRTVTSAGIFDMKWDRTLANLPTHLKRAVEERDVPIHDLPYRTFGADLLVEGCGWVELHMDVRNKHIKDENYAPQVEVFTPNGRHVGWRQSIVAYSWIDERKRKAKRRSPSRGRQSIGMKKRQYGGVATE